MIGNIETVLEPTVRLGILLVFAARARKPSAPAVPFSRGVS